MLFIRWRRLIIDMGTKSILLILYSQIVESMYYAARWVFVLVKCHRKSGPEIECQRKSKDVGTRRTLLHLHSVSLYL